MRELHDFVYDSENPEKNLQLAIWYHNKNHTASAISFYLRCAERTTDDDLAYACLIRCFQLFDQQGNRQLTTLNCINRAITLLPKRPEAYYILSRHYEGKQHWQSAYMQACTGLNVADINLPNLKLDVGYPGPYGLTFQKSVAAWWWGNREETKSITRTLISDYYYTMNEAHRQAIRNNVSNIDMGLTYDEKTDSFVKKFDWGVAAKNDWFRRTVEKEIFEDNFYEKFVEVKQGDVVFDIGASCGPFTYSIKDKGASKIVCVEPHKQLYGTLLENTQNIDNVVYIDRAVGSHDGKEVIYGLFNEELTETAEEENACEVDMISFDTLLKQTGVDHIDFLKIDCEGGEYDVFREDNIDWIQENVRYIVGEWHLTGQKYKDKFRQFRDTYLTRFKNFKIFSFDEVDITDTVWFDWFIERYDTINVYIDNRIQVSEVKTYTPSNDLIVTDRVLKDYWRVTDWPTLEITTNIAKKGCVVDCVFCPQRVLEQSYTDEKRYMTLDEFKEMIDKVPSEVRITFAGFTEPWLNKNCTDMLLYAHEKGHPISVFTTGVGMKPQDVERLADIPYAGMPNGGFTLHLPDQERLAKHPINDNYIKVIEKFKELEHRFQNFYTMAMAEEVHESISHIYSEAVVPNFWNRAGNLIGEAILKPELEKVADRVLSQPVTDEDRTCGCVEDLYHNILLPNGDVSLCCMDYSLEYILGNLKTQNYDDIVPKQGTCFDLCRKCENGVEPKPTQKKTEKNVNNFSINLKTKPSAWIVDNFYDDPDSVRRFALQQQFDDDGQLGTLGRGYIGRRTFNQFLFPGLKERFEQIMGHKIVKWEDYGMNGRFQVCYAGEPLVYHCDAQRWAGMLYLTPDAPYNSGTTLYAHKETKIRHNSHPDIMKTFAHNSGGGQNLDRTPYEPVDVLGNVYNRLVIFDAGNIHSASEYFGFNYENARLWQMFFFD